MSFSKEWEDTYRAGGHNSVWPWSEVVSFVKRFTKDATHPLSVVELGCGPGANIPFFREIGAEYYAIDGSQSAVDAIVARFPDLAEQVVVGDFTTEIPFERTFDIVLDRGSLTHNDTTAMRRAIRLCHAALKPKGLLVAVDWFSTAHSEYPKGVATDDPWTKTGYTVGQFAGVGRAHFCDEQLLRELLEGFSLRYLEHKTIQRHLPDDGWISATWNFVAEKE